MWTPGMRKTLPLESGTNAQLLLNFMGLVECEGMPRLSSKIFRVHMKHLAEEHWDNIRNVIRGLG